MGLIVYSNAGLYIWTSGTLACRIAFNALITYASTVAADPCHPDYMGAHNAVWVPRVYSSPDYTLPCWVGAGSERLAACLPYGAAVLLGCLPMPY